MRWTQEEIAILFDITKSVKEVTSLTGRTKNAILMKSRKLKINRVKERRTMSFGVIMDDEEIEKLRGREVFTTGQVAKLFSVAMRTVAKWTDAELLKGYRIPGSKSRRILREELVAFAQRTGNKIALKRLAPPIVLVGVDEQTKAAIVAEFPGREITTCVTGFMAGITLGSVCACVVVDAGTVGRVCAQQIAMMCGPRAVVLLTEDTTMAELLEWDQEKTGAKLRKKPCNPAAVAAIVKEICR